MWWSWKRKVGWPVFENAVQGGSGTHSDEQTKNYPMRWLTEIRGAGKQETNSKEVGLGLQGGVQGVQNELG